MRYSAHHVLENAVKSDVCLPFSISSENCTLQRRLLCRTGNTGVLHFSMEEENFLAPCCTINKDKWRLKSSVELASYCKMRLKSASSVMHSMMRATLKVKYRKFRTFFLLSCLWHGEDVKTAVAWTISGKKSWREEKERLLIGLHYLIL